MNVITSLITIPGRPDLNLPDGLRTLATADPDTFQIVGEVSIVGQDDLMDLLQVLAILPITIHEDDVIYTLDGMGLHQV